MGSSFQEWASHIYTLLDYSRISIFYIYIYKHWDSQNNYIDVWFKIIAYT